MIPPAVELEVAGGRKVDDLPELPSAIKHRLIAHIHACVRASGVGGGGGGELE